MTRPEDAYPYARNERAVILRVGTVAAVGTSTVDVDMPGGTRLNGVPSTFTPKVGAQIVLLLDRDNALAVGPVASAAPVWTPTTGMKVFQATQTTAQSVPDSVYTALTWTTVEDPYSSWSSGAATRFKPTFAGNFLLNGGVGFAYAGPATYNKPESQRRAGWYRNGALTVLACDDDSSAIGVAVVARPYLVSLNGTTDYVELVAWHNIGAALNTNVAAGFTSTITVTYAGP